jgi:hypothetical protein
MDSPSFLQTRGQQPLSSQTGTPSRQGRLAPAQAGPSRSSASLASKPVRPALQTVITPSASTSSGFTSTVLDKVQPSTEHDLSPVTPTDDHEELLYQKPSKQQRLGQPAPSSRFTSKSKNLSPSASSTSATTSQRCVSAPSLGTSGRLQKAPAASRSSAKRRPQNHVTAYSSPAQPLRANPSFQIDRIEGDGARSSVSTPGSTGATPIVLDSDESDVDMLAESTSPAGNPTEAENSSDTENPDSPSPKPRRPVNKARDLSSSSINPGSAVRRNRFKVPSDDSSSNEDEAPVSGCLDDPFAEDATPQVEDGEDEPTSSPTTLLEFENYRAGGHHPLREINEAIRDLLIKQSKPNKEPKGGFVYVMHCPDDASSYLKIGKTHNVPEKRFKTWSKECRLHLSPVLDPSPPSSSSCNTDAFLSYGLVESIIQREFHNQRKQYYCKHHRRRHDEWFDISSETAYHSINRWRTWLVAEQPFDKSTGKLKPYWQWKVDNLNKNYSTLDWDVWTRPIFWDKWEYSCDDYPRVVLVLKHLRRKDLRFCMMACVVSFLGYFLYDGLEGKWCFFVLSLLVV